jgi:alpha-methylacyl-CoA racemase
MVWGMLAADRWRDERGINVLDSGAPWYDTYETSDGKHFAVGAIEPKFYAELLHHLGLGGEALPPQLDRDGWPVLREKFAQAFAGKTRAQWESVFAGSDACAAPVLSFTEAAAHPHAKARGAHATVDGIVQPAPAPRFSRTPGEIRGGPPQRGGHGGDALRDWGFDDAAIARLRALGVGHTE